MIKQFWKRIRKNFFTGLIIVVPVLGSFFIFSWCFIKITNLLIQYIPDQYLSNQSMRILARFIGLISMGIGIIFIGWFTKNYFGRKFVDIWENIFTKIPLFNRIYVALKQIMNAFWGTDKAIFEDVVLIEYPRPGIYAIAFVTSRAEGEIQDKTPFVVANVFVPTTPNPTSGVFVLVPEKDLIPLQMSVEEGLKLVISGGAVTPNYANRLNSNK